MDTSKNKNLPVALPQEEKKISKATNIIKKYRTEILIVLASMISVWWYAYKNYETNTEAQFPSHMENNDTIIYDTYTIITEFSKLIDKGSFSQKDLEHMIYVYEKSKNTMWSFLREWDDKLWVYEWIGWVHAIILWMFSSILKEWFIVNWHKDLEKLEKYLTIFTWWEITMDAEKLEHPNHKVTMKEDGISDNPEFTDTKIITANLSEFITYAEDWKIKIIKGQITLTQLPKIDSFLQSFDTNDNELKVKTISNLFRLADKDLTGAKIIEINAYNKIANTRSELSSKLNQVQWHLKARNIHIGDLQERIIEIEKSHIGLIIELNKKHKTAENLIKTNSTNKSLEDEKKIEEANEKLRKLKDKLKEESDSYKTTINLNEWRTISQVEISQKLNSQLSSTISDMITIWNRKDTKIKELKDNWEKAKAQIIKIEEEKKKLQSEKTTTARANQYLIGTKDNQIEGLESEVTKLQARKDTLEATISKKDNIRNKSNDENYILSVINEKIINIDLKNIKKDIIDLKKELLSLKEKVKKPEYSLREIKLFKLDIKSYSKFLVILERIENGDIHKKKLELKSKDLTKSELKRDEQQTELSEANEEISRYTKIVDTKDLELASVNEAFKISQNRIQELESNDDRKVISELQNTLKETESTVKQLRDTIEEKDKKVGELKKEKDDRKKLFQTL